MNIKRCQKAILRGLIVVLALGLGACAGTVIDTVSDAAIAVAKVPFKVGGAVVDIASDDD